ncbi:Histone deacetylase RPD3 [Mycena chlorophos]|uniref:Histone deacetylase RPD3 n=1 Tax=Mycena chlorophos TaxID=658473 RepID=A0A8H6T1R7_MYCCL|nr:Histone deacetylase RPD3 [Mycena chlorophos]
MSRRRVAYYYDPDVGGYTYGPGHPMKPHRVRITHDLVGAYGMLDKMHVLRPQRATPNAMSAFHTDEYVNFLKRVTPETSEQLTHGGLLFLVGELPDNPAFEGLFERRALAQLQELASRAAPSVALQDVPRQALGSHMGFRSMKGLRRDAHGGYGPGIPDPEDELDLRVRDRVGTLFDHQETARLERERQQDDSDASSSDDSEGSDDEDDDDTRSGSRFGNGNNITGKRRKRMSIVTNQYIDVAPPPPRPNGRHASVPVNAQATIPPLVAQPQQGPALSSVPANKRRFFQVFPTPWDARPNAAHVLNGISPGAADVGAAMENGGVDVDIEDDADVEPEPEPEREERTGRGVTRATVRAARERGLLRDPLAAFEDAEEMDVDMDSDGEPARKRGGNWRGRAAPKGKGGGGRGRGANRGRAIAITNREDTQSVADSNGVDREMDLEGPEEEDGEDGVGYGAARMRSGMGW